MTDQIRTLAEEAAREIFPQAFAKADITLDIVTTTDSPAVRAAAIIERHIRKAVEEAESSINIDYPAGGPKRLGEIVKLLLAETEQEKFLDLLDAEFLGPWNDTLKELRPSERRYILKDIRGLAWALAHPDRVALPPKWEDPSDMLSIEQVDALRSRVASLEQEKNAAMNLLAVLHRDGGHHTEEVGFFQSCLDGENVWRVLIQRAEHAEARVKELENERDGLRKAEQEYWIKWRDDGEKALAFLKMAANGPTEIVSTQHLSALEIEQARCGGRMYVEPGGGVGWVVRLSKLPQKSREEVMAEFNVLPAATELAAAQARIEELEKENKRLQERLINNG